ncbi:hypothetical protein ADK67_47125 [Saccharothrix sp. NRRL B-16348]|uniref:hypothetical protein n=1 Tax=Saccharothrix sp. NRRL B-16348 TaxID=1415542 RepID=UPI0006ADE63B|nr:hypothetical protein [Saccharothrix sp. NRRL B-16348]KOX12587.1 hypothetical protein ADK67_47125 [Saccharothrix sp. NRRL B-16348]
MTTFEPGSAPGTAPGFDVDLTALVTHQQHLGAVLEQLADALQAASDAHLPEEAFGPFGAPLAAAIKPTAEEARGAFERAVESVGAHQDGMLRTVREYDEVERANADMLHIREVES